MLTSDPPSEGKIIQTYLVKAQLYSLIMKSMKIVFFQ